MRHGWLQFLWLNLSLAAALYEPDNGSVYLGAWYDRINGDTPSLVNSRINHKPFSLFQVDVNITETLQADELKQFARQLDQTGTDAVMYLTIYPFKGFDVVSETALSQLASILADIRKSGRRIIIRYASEMNGSWFAYGQTPSKFIREWRRFVDYIRARTQGVAFLWSPNSGNGYPFVNFPFSVKPNTSAWDEMDTNKDGVVDILDDPYTPFWPGAEYVDWVGMSVYHYGAQWPWVTNDVPIPGKAERILLGLYDNAPINYNIYEMFSGANSPYKKPFVLAETGGTYHVESKSRIKVKPGASNLAIKQGWWRQILNTTFLDRFSKIKAICFFEFAKMEEETFRDFRSMSVEDGIADAFRADLGEFSHAIYAGPFQGKYKSSEESSGSLVCPAWTWYGLFAVLVHLVLFEAQVLL